MSDQGERDTRWTEMSESEPREAPAKPHDVWGKVEGPPAEAPEDVKVAPVPADEPPQWEGSLFDEGPDDEASAPGNYAPPAGAGEPGKPGKPSSGNWQMPDWMADEAAADAKLGGATGRRGDRDDLDGGRSRLWLFGGVGLLVAALVAAGAVYLLRGNGDEPEDAGDNTGRAAAEQPESTKPDLPAQKKLATFPGSPSRMLGRVADARSGLSFPRLAPPWQVRGKAGAPGWSGQQIMVTERGGGKLRYGQLLTGTLPSNLQGAYQGPDTAKKVADMAAKGYESRYYAFPHKSAPLASQELSVDGHPGWLVASYVTYRQAGVRATGELVATAVIDTGRRAPAVVFASVPNTHKQRYPDVNAFFAHLQVPR